MKGLNRKAYKKVIRNFRDSQPLARVHHQWVLLKDEYRDTVLMYVLESYVKRTKWTYGFKEDPYCFEIVLVGFPTITFSWCTGIRVSMFGKKEIKTDTENGYKIIDKSDVDRVFMETSQGILKKCVGGIRWRH